MLQATTIQYLKGDKLVDNPIIYGLGAEFTEGRFKIGSDKEEVWKTYVPDKTLTKKEGIMMDYGDAHVWPSYRIQYIPRSFVFMSWSRSNGGHAQGTHQYIDGTFDIGDRIKTFDSAGGYGHFKIEAKESSMWHPVSIIIRVEEQNKTILTPDNEKFSFTKRDNSWYKYDDNEGHLDIVQEIFDWNSDYDIEKIEEQDNTNPDFISVTYKNALIQRFKITKKKSAITNDRLRKGAADFDLWYNVGPNNYPNSSRTTIVIESFFDALGNEKSTGYNNLPYIGIGNWTQPANTLYYANMAWVSKPKSIISKPSPIADMTVDSTSTDFTLYLYVELGISVNGGQDIWWNSKVPNTSLSSETPSDIYNYITVTAYKNDPKFDATKKYNRFSVQKYGGNYVQVNGSSLPNNDSNNSSDEKSQEYTIENVTFNPDNKKTIPYIPKPGWAQGKKTFQLVGSDDTDDEYTLMQSFEVMKRTKTKDWNIKLVATLNYGKYHVNLVPNE